MDAHVGGGDAISGPVEVTWCLPPTTLHPIAPSPTQPTMDLAAQENQARAERWEKGAKIGEGTYANVYKGASFHRQC